MFSSRTKHLQVTLKELGFEMALKAFHLVINEMCIEKGYTRHNGTHFYPHPVDVTQKLINYRFLDEDIITAALLHDLVEDVPGYTIEWIAAEFNHNVARMVFLLTKDPTIDYKEPVNVTDYLNEILEDFGASLIKTSDRIHNSMTLEGASPEKRIRYAIETKTFYIPFFKKCQERYTEANFFFFEAKTQIEPILWWIEWGHNVELSLTQRILELEQELSSL